MAWSRSPWRALRPVLLAGAATLTWLTFSSTAASADVLSDTTSLVGGVTDSVFSVPEKLLSPAPAVPSTPAGTQPVVGSISALADDIVASVPVVQHVVPVGTVQAVTAPVARIADGATSAVVEAVVPPVAEAAPVLEPVLDPVTDLVTGTAPLPVPVPALPGPAIDNETPPAIPNVAPADKAKTNAADTPQGTEDLLGSNGTSTEMPVVVPDLQSVAAPLDGATRQTTSALASLTFFEPSRAAGSPGTADPSPRPGPVPAAPGVSGAGSGASSAGGSSGSAAWLSSFDFHHPVDGLYRIGEHSKHVPAPVSFDPGSSPD